MDKLGWERHIAAFKTSGLSARAYARQHELVYHRFRYRLRRCCEPEPVSDFVPVHLSAQPIDGDCVGVVEFPTGARLVLHRAEAVGMLPDWLLGRT